MSPLFRVPLGIAVMFIGFLFVWKTEVVYSWTGPIEFAENKLGSTRLFLKLIGILVVFVGIFIATNIISDMLASFASIFAPSV